MHNIAFCEWLIADGFALAYVLQTLAAYRFCLSVFQIWYLILMVALYDSIVFILRHNYISTMSVQRYYLWLIINQMILFHIGRVSFAFISNSFEMHRLSFSSEWIVLFVSNILNESVECSDNILLPLQTVLSTNPNLFVINYRLW